MIDEKIITCLDDIKKKCSDNEHKEVIDIAVEAIKLRQKTITELNKAIDAERASFSQRFNDDFNHHIWIMRGLQIAKQIVEGGDYEKF